MTFLTWNNEQDATDSLAAIDTVYGCSYEGDSGYVMATWDTVTKHDTSDLWGFNAPSPRLGKTQEELDAVLVAGYTEGDKPSDWLPVVDID